MESEQQMQVSTPRKPSSSRAAAAAGLPFLIWSGFVLLSMGVGITYLGLLDQVSAGTIGFHHHSQWTVDLDAPVSAVQHPEQQQQETKQEISLSRLEHPSLPLTAEATTITTDLVATSDAKDTSVSQPSPALRGQVSKNPTNDTLSSVPPTDISATTTNRVTVNEFERQERVVIATKIHSGPQAMNHLKQSMCLLHYAYNDRVNYDILVFTALPLKDTEIQEMQQLVAPAKFTVVLDNDGLDQMIAKFTPAQQQNLMERCKVDSIDKIHWDMKCASMKGMDPLKYNWQAEFRTLHIWEHPELEAYRYMLWMDTDGFCTKKWDHDPISMMINNDLVVLFDNFPQGQSRGQHFHERFRAAFGDDVCAVKLVDGVLVPRRQAKCEDRSGVQQIHGFFHVTDLDFYRSEPVMKWMKILIGDEGRFQRDFDDQIAITVPAAVLAGNRSWDMGYHGFTPEVFHNGNLDGKADSGPGGMPGFWKRRANVTFPEAWGKCEINAYS